MNTEIDDINDTIYQENTTLSEKNKNVKRHPDVDVFLSSISELMNIKDYNMGRFITLILNRMNLVDDFWMKGIACCKYNPQIRRIDIIINPYMLWHYLLRHNALHDKSSSIYKILGIDNILAESLEKGGWTPSTFKIWIEFLSDKTTIQNTEFVKCYMSVVVHEVLHCIWNHLSKDRKSVNHKISNIAQDFAINQTLDFARFNPKFMTTLNKNLLFSFYKGGAPIIKDKQETYTNMEKAFDRNDKTTFWELFSTISIGDFNTSIFLHQPYEYYYALLTSAKEHIDQILKNSKLTKSDTKDSSDDGDDMEDMYDMFQHVLGQEDETSDMTDEELQQAIADALSNGNYRSDTGVEQFSGFSPISSEMKKVVKNDIKRTVDDMLSRGEINSISDLVNQKPFNLNRAFVKAIENLYKTDCKDWDKLLKNQIMKCLGMRTYDYTMKREARGASDMFPGKARLRSFDLIIVIDVSGSINFEDYNRFINEIEKIAKQVDHPCVRVIQFHSRVSLDIVIPLKKLKSIGIPETGGTNMKVPLDKLQMERNKKMVVVFTDGWVENDLENTYNFPSVIFVSSSGNEHICTSLHKRGWKVIYQDGDNNWWN